MIICILRAHRTPPVVGCRMVRSRSGNFRRVERRRADRFSSENRFSKHK
ncbi:hypothetical protein BN938_2237 [Mucinivorans hirudinis]|uniref:Uncharacterized protein n=1 Tax=Mucinivorans hirudinis TaxID=1433126 RepID=A0A060RE25_9BACT|nr:hypothetical protein BN938_2237 [Mucinivorans hirudinis]